MPERNYPPAYLRYLKARLSNFLRPDFWGTGVFLVALGLVVRAYWLNPAIFTELSNQEVQKEAVEKVKTEETTEATTLSEEDKAIAADIDNMPSLLSDVAQATLLVPTTNIENNTQKNKNTTVVENINPQTVPANEVKSPSNLTTVNNVYPVYPPIARNPFVVQAETLLNSHSSYTGNQLLGVNNLSTSQANTEPTNSYNLGRNLTNQINNQNINNQNTIIVSPSETTIQNLQQLNNTNQVITSVSDRGLRQISPINSLPTQSLTYNSRMGYVQPSITNQPQNSYSNFNNAQTLPNVNIPANGINPVNNNPNIVQPSIPGVTNSTTSEGYRNYGNSSVQQPGQLPPSNLYYPGQIQQGNNIYQR